MIIDLKPCTAMYGAFCYAIGTNTLLITVEAIMPRNLFKISVAIAYQDHLQYPVLTHRR